MAEAFIGLDLGTTGIKAVAFDAADRELAAAAMATPTHRTADGGAEYDADELWATACAVLRRVTNRLAAAANQPVAIATASMGESGVLVDDGGVPVAPVLAWFDPRTEPQAAWWVENVGAARTTAITGIPPRAVFGATKMLWMREHRGDAWRRGRRWLNIADWAAYRLSGRMATDHTLASRTMLFDLAARRWSDELLDAAALDPALLAPLVPSGHPLGPVLPAAAAATGLPTTVQVGAGGQDHVCAALALGVTEPGMLLDSIGTAEAFFLVSEGFDATGRVAAAGIGQGAHVIPDRTYAMTGLQRGGGRIDARRIELGLDWPDFLASAEGIEITEEVAREGQARIGELMAATGTDAIRHLATGGGSRNRLLIERKRDLGGRPIEVATQTEATAAGAAALARRAVGVR
ncbi:MAG: FGGY family carbohydrate kinase [Actinomycetota bacterium]